MKDAELVMEKLLLIMSCIFAEDDINFLANSDLLICFMIFLQVFT